MCLAYKYLEFAPLPVGADVRACPVGSDHAHRLCGQNASMDACVHFGHRPCTLFASTVSINLCKCAPLALISLISGLAFAHTALSSPLPTPCRSSFSSPLCLPTPSSLNPPPAFSFWLLCVEFGAVDRAPSPVCVLFLAALRTLLQLTCGWDFQLNHVALLHCWLSHPFALDIAPAVCAGIVNIAESSACVSGPVHRLVRDSTQSSMCSVWHAFLCGAFVATATGAFARICANCALQPVALPGQNSSVFAPVRLPALCATDCSHDVCLRL